MKPTIYAMIGTIGSGKTTFAKKIASEKATMLFCIDDDIKRLGLPVGSKENYDKYYYGVRAIITEHAIKSLKLGISVVFDFGGSVGHWEWLHSIAKQTNSEIEIFHLLAPLDVRRERVRRRNAEPDVVFRFSDEEFNSMPRESATPPEQSGLKVTVIDTSK